MSELLLNSSYEQAVIGCLLIDPEMFDQVLSLISSADFDDPTNAEFFSFLCDLHEFGIPVNDIKLVASEAKKRELKIDVAGITEAFTSVPFSDHAVFYAKEVAELSRRRKLADLQSEINDKLKSPGADSGEITNLIESRLKTIDTANGIELDNANDAVRKYNDNAESAMMAMSGFYHFDDEYGGFSGGELIGVGARLGSGKTAFGWQVMLHNLKLGRNCLFVSLEMKTRQLMQRHFASVTGIQAISIRTSNLTKRELERIELEKELFLEYPVSIFAPPRATVRQIGAAARLKRAGSGLQLMVVDYIQLIRATSKGKDRRSELEEISRDLKSLASELETPIIALCQLNRAADGVIPRVSQIAESDTIGRDADQILLLHRKENSTDLRVAKHRYVADDTAIELKFENGKFVDQRGTPWEP